MHLTLQEALSIYPLSEAKLVAGAQGTSRILKSINIMDAPDIADWVKAGEMVFTTGFLFKDRPDEAIALIHRLNHRGCVGIGIKLGRFWENIPEEVIDEANKIQFPILVLPFEFTFSDQMKALFHAEYEKNTKILQNVLDKQKRLMQYALRKNEFEDIFHTIEEVLEYPIAVISARGHLFYNTSDWPEKAILSGMPWKNIHHWVTTQYGSCFRIPLIQNENCSGFLLIMINTSKGIKEEEALFHQAAEILAYHLGKSYQDYVNQTVQNELGRLMKLYLQRQIPIERLMEHAKQKGFEFMDHPYQCVFIRSSYNSSETLMETVMQQVRQQLEYHPEMRKYEVQHFDLDEGIFSIYSFPNEKSGTRELQKFLLEICKEWIRQNDERMPRFYISKLKTKPQSLIDSYQECLEAQKFSIRFGLTGVVIPFETIEFAYVFQHIPLEVMKNYCDKMLQPLTTKEKEYAGDMIKTLEAFVENNGQINEAANQLHIHRNTVSYRLDKMTDILQVDLKNMNDLLKLKMVFIFRNFIQNEHR